MPPQNEKEVISDVVRVKGAKRDRAAVEEEVLSTGERHTLTKGTPFHVPLQKAVWSQFTAVMGNHGAAVRLAWLPLTAVVEGVAVELAVKLEHALAACGVQLLSLTTTASQGAHPLYPVADYLITGTIEASAAVVAMLCKSSPIVTPQYFIAVKDRASPLDPTSPSRGLSATSMRVLEDPARRSCE
ncbi:hypothetical protein AGDE_13670 [Angomonas deanei]|uniref:Uncharacterized protein n=1 Tax=Angomonas deanei TaxID=59799 RepID=A0A7G2CJX4_9TRYP|nr:hypothetical protein AGDE_13670 [Angomonas deanei]CAD2220106.1 hypothetical protein, conserved [Angomonas deanei]|eukprot:EPY21968.1 hypothetical protein AGDE_13670 [Angomonas deanei]